MCVWLFFVLLSFYILAHFSRWIVSFLKRSPSIPFTGTLIPQLDRHLGELVFKCSPLELDLEPHILMQPFGPSSLVRGSDPASQRLQNGQCLAQVQAGWMPAGTLEHPLTSPLARVGWWPPHSWSKAAGLEPVCPVLPRGLRNLSPIPRVASPGSHTGTSTCSVKTSPWSCSLSSRTLLSL